MLFSNFIGSTVTVAIALLGVSNAAPAPLAEFSRRDGLRFPYGQEKVRGVNLGGWFVLEPWITPSLFEQWGDSREVVDEFTFCAVLGKQEAKKRLEQHWSTWITEADIQAIANAGMNHVRVPIGYWSVIPVKGEPYVQGAYKHLGALLDWAAGAGLKVMIDLHGAPGSQNGFDNSGRYGAIDWTQGNTVKHTIKVLNKIRNDYGGHSAVATIEALNEPMGPELDMNTIKQFYDDAWGNIVKDGKHLALTVHDAFEGVGYWNSWGDGMWWTMLDTHHYEVFDVSQLQMSPTDHVSSACSFGGTMRGGNKWTISGEWTGAQTDCAKWLNGLGKGARYDGTYENDTPIGSCAGKYQGSVAGLSSDDKKNIRQFIEAQLDAYESAAGWIFWTWKTESAPEWNMKGLLAHGLFPQPLTDRQYPGQCG